MIYAYGGFRPESDPDQKHWSFDLLKPLLSAYSTTASDLRKFASPRHNQEHSGSCVAQATIKALELKRIQKYGQSQHVDLSRLAVYYLSREMMDPPETDQDKGTHISLAADVLRRFGVCRENQDPNKPDDKSFWPFDLNLLFTSPGWLQMRQAYIHKISSWYKIYSVGDDRVNDVILALASGNPIVYGTQIDTNWQTYNGTPLGNPTGTILGGHATVLEGWDPVGGFFWGENSWGNWGPDDGFYKLLPEVIASTNSSDFIVMMGNWEPFIQKV
jgi:hypothetical protein